MYRRRLALIIAVALPCGMMRGTSVDAAAPALFGSGFVVHPDGYVVTERAAVRVASDAVRVEDSYTEVVLGETSYEARVVAVDDIHGLALLKVDATGLPWLPLVDTTTLELGAEVRGFGRAPVWSPDQSAELTRGIISSISLADGGRAVQIDADVKPGHAGGPYVDQRGAVVGVIGAGEKSRSIGVQAVQSLLDAAQVPPLPGVERAEDLSGVELARQVSPAVAYVQTLVRRSVFQTHAGQARVVGLFGSDVLITQGYGEDPTVKLWSTSTGRLLATYGMKGHGIVDASFCPRKGILVTAGDRGNLLVVSLTQGKTLGTWPAFVRGDVTDDGYQPEPANVQVVISADGSTVAAFWWGRLRVWDLAGKLLGDIPLTESRFGQVRWAISPNGNQVAFMHEGEPSAGHEVRLYDRQQRRVTRSFPVEFPIFPLAFSPDGRWLTVDGMRQIWDLQGGREVGLHGEHGYKMEAVAMAEDADRFVAANDGWVGDNSAQVFINVWDRTRRVLLAWLHSDSYPRENYLQHTPNWVGISADALSVATADKTGLVHVWHLHTLADQLPALTVLNGHQQLSNSEHPWADTQIALASQGELVCSLAREVAGETVRGVLAVSDPRTGVPRRTWELQPLLTATSAGTLALAVSFDGRRIASARALPEEGGGFEIAVRDRETGDVVRTLHFPQMSFPLLELSAHGEHLFARGQRVKPSTAPGDTGQKSYELACRVWNVDSGEVWPSLKDSEATELNVQSLDFAPDGHTFLTTEESGRRLLWDSASRGVLHTLDLPGRTVTDAAYSHDGRWIATTVQWGVVLWDVSTGQVVREFSPVPQSGPAAITALYTPRFSPAGDLLAALAYFDDRQLRLIVWSVGDGAVRHALTDAAGTSVSHVRDLRFTDDGGRLIAACSDCTLRTLLLEYVPRPSVVAEAYRVRAERWLAEMQYDQADADLGRVIELAPWRAATYAVRAEVRLKQAKVAEAETDLTAALDLDPQNAAVYLRRASLRYDAERFQDALADFDLALTFGPRDHFRLIDRGKCHEALAHYPAAIEDYTAAIQGWPFGLLTEAVLHRGLCYVRTQQWREALADLQKVETFVPDDLQERFTADLALATTEAAKLPALVVKPAEPAPEAAPRPADPPAEVIPGDKCLVRLTAPADAAVTVDGRDYGTRREIEFTGLEPGRRYVSQLVIHLAGGEARRAVPVMGGTTVQIAAAVPSQIVVLTASGENEFGVFSVQPDGSRGRRLASMTRECSCPVLSPDGTKVAFVREPAAEDAPGYELCVIDVEGGRERVVLNGASDSPPVWMADSRSLITRVHEADANHMVVVDVQTAAQTVKTPGDHAAPSPDGRTLAVARYHPAQKRTYIDLIGADGAGERPLCEGWYSAWSPDGTQLLVVRGRETPLPAVTQAPRTDVGGLPEPPRPAHGLEYDLHAIRPDSTDDRVLARDISFLDLVAPQWSPDGRTVAYYLKKDSNLYVIHSDGSNARQLTFYEDRKLGQDGSEHTQVLYFQWSPDASQLVFEKSSYRLDFREKLPLPHHAPSEIWTVNTDGTGLQKVVGWAGSSYQPTWR